MKHKTINSEMQVEQCHIRAYLDSFPLSRVLRDRQARLAPHKGAILQSATGEEL